MSRIIQADVIAAELAELMPRYRARRKAEILHRSIAELLPYTWIDGDITITITSISVTTAGDLSVNLKAARYGKALLLNLPFNYRNPPVISHTGEFQQKLDVDPLTGKAAIANVPVFAERPLQTLKLIIAETVRAQA